MSKTVFFAIPSYKGIRCTQFFKALEESVNYCQSLGWETNLCVLQGCCYVQVARNKLVKAFLESTAENLFFLDDDISWDCKDTVRLLEMDDDIVAGVYPHKTDSENYPVVIHTDDNGFPLVRADGCLKGAMIPFGFVRIKRHVIQRMWDTYQSLRYVDYQDGTEVEFIDLFPQGVKDYRWVGEDFAFCQLWQELGGEIAIVPDIDFYHYTDVAGFKGNYHKFLLACPGGSEYVPPDEPEFAGESIPGWMSLDEQKFLYVKSSQMDSVVEIGSFLGRSAKVLLEGKAKKVYCVDNWQPYRNVKDDTPEKAEARYQKFLENVKDHTGNGRLTIMRMNSVEAAGMFEDKSVDMVFIDGDHSEQGIKSDIEAWLPKANKMICGHDYTFSWPDVRKVVNEVFGGRVKLTDTIWYVDL